MHKQYFISVSLFQMLFLYLRCNFKSYSVVAKCCHGKLYGWRSKNGKWLHSSKRGLKMLICWISLSHWKLICPWKVIEICLFKFVWTMIQYRHVSFNLLMKWHHCYSKSISFVATQLEQRIITCINDGCTVKPRNHGKKK